MDLRNFGGRDVDIDLERGMDEAIYEEHSEGKRVEGEEKMGLLDNKWSRRGRKKGSRKPPKPPRPPCAPLLDAADRKLVREISELATLKRARVERMKALKNKKTTEGASSGSNLCALVVTILFCFIIIWQGYIILLEGCRLECRKKAGCLECEANKGAKPDHLGTTFSVRRDLIQLRVLIFFRIRVMRRVFKRQFECDLSRFSSIITRKQERIDLCAARPENFPRPSQFELSISLGYSFP